MVSKSLNSAKHQVNDPHSTAILIREKACELFARSGYDQTSVARIAQEVGVVEGAVYRHYSSKRDLLHQVIQAFYEPLIESVEQGASVIEDPKKRLRYLIERHLRAFTEDPAVCRLVISEVRSMDDYYESEVADLNRRYTSLVLTAFAEGVEQGLFRSDLPPALIRDLVFGCIEHLAWGTLTGTHAIDLVSMSDFVFQTVCSGIEIQTKAPDSDLNLERLERVTRRLEHLADRSDSSPKP